MHGYIIFCLVAATTAAQLGYDYKQVGQTATVGGIGLNGNEAGEPGGIDIRFGGSTSGTSNAHGSGPNGFHNSIDTTGLSGSGANRNSNGFSSIGGLNGINSNPSHVEFNKEFYTYSAPEDNFNDHDSIQQAARHTKKKLRVIFIRAPENQAFTNAALQLAKHASEDHTAIYVLTKQANIGALVNQLQTIKSSHTNKPEVHFVKYRTPEEAVHAQQVIQSQYDSLGGSTHSSNEGVAPVLNFASPSSSSAAIGGFSGNSNSHDNGAGVAGSSSSSYLPPAVRST